MSEKPILFSAPMVRALLDGRKTQTRRVVKPQPDDKGWWNPDATKRHGGYWRNVESGAGAPQTDCPYGQSGDRLIVRETWTAHWGHAGGGIPTMILFDGEKIKQRDGSFTETSPHNPLCVYHRASFGDGVPLPHLKWKPSIHMPRWASRLTLEVTDVRVERLQEISEADAIAEGCIAETATPYHWWEGYRTDLLDRYGNQSHTMVPFDAFPDGPPAWMGEPRLHKGETAGNIPAVKNYQLLWNAVNHHVRWDDNPFVWVVTFKVVAPLPTPQIAAA